MHNVLRWTSLAAAMAGGVLAMAATVPASAAQAQILPPDNVICQGTATVTFGSPVTDTPAPNTMKTSGQLTDCYSPDGTDPSVASGTLTDTGSGTWSCGDPETGSGTATFTWYNASGQQVGSTTVPGSGDAKGDQGDSEIANAETGTASLSSTLFALQQFRGAFVPTAVAGDCTAGITSLSGEYTITISGV
jgi:hypothetical protein